MSQKITPGTIVLLATAPLMWAGNAVTGKLVYGLIPPITLNFIRWMLAFIILLPFAWQVLRPNSDLWQHWRRYSLLGLLGVGSYNALQYMALQTSSPLNVTLVSAGTPVWMLIIGALFFGVPARPQQIAGAMLSVVGVLTVLSHGSLQQLLSLRLVTGDLYIVLATIAWAFYSWLLVRTTEPAGIRSNWAAFLMAQMVFGVVWSGAFAGAEWSLGQRDITWGWPLAAVLAFIVMGPAILAYRN